MLLLTLEADGIEFIFSREYIRGFEFVNQELPDVFAKEVLCLSRLLQDELETGPYVQFYRLAKEIFPLSGSEEIQGYS